MTIKELLKSDRAWMIFLFIISLIQTSQIIDYSTLDGLWRNDDHPKYFSNSLDNAKLLISYGTPYGFDHNFQGGIPTIYPANTFLEHIPFALLFGYQMGYQLMIICFIGLTPISFFLLTKELTKRIDIAKFASLISIFNQASINHVSYGIIPAIVATPLSLFSCYFFLKYLKGQKGILPLSLSIILLTYTHPAILTLTSIFFGIVIGYKITNQKIEKTDIKRLALLGLICGLIVSPLGYNLLIYRDFFRVDWGYTEDINFTTMISNWISYFPKPLKVKNLVFLSLIPLAFVYVSMKESPIRHKIQVTLLFGLLLLFLQTFIVIPRFAILIQRLNWIFVPYIFIFNLSLLLIATSNRKLGFFACLIILTLVLPHFQPSKQRHIETISNYSNAGGNLGSIISSEDYVVIENSAHINPAVKGVENLKETWIPPHWITYIQKDLEAKFFSHRGNDAHPYNNLRHMYITNGLYRGKRLEGENGVELVNIMRDFGVNKACVWSKPSKMFFKNHKNFKIIGKKGIYLCLNATYTILPPISVDGKKVGEIVNETPFSFTVKIDNITSEKKINVNKNYFSFWKAKTKSGKEVKVNACEQKMCFNATDGETIFFRYKKNLHLNFLIPLSIILSIMIDKKK